MSHNLKIGILLISIIFIACNSKKSQNLIKKDVALHEEIEISNKANDLYSEFVARDDLNKKMELQGLTKNGFHLRELTCKWRIRFAIANLYDIKKWRQLKGGMVFYNQAAGTASGTTMPHGYNQLKAYKENPQVPITVINGSHDLVDFRGTLHGKWLNPILNVNYFMVENAGHILGQISQMK